MGKEEEDGKAILERARLKEISKGEQKHRDYTNWLMKQCILDVENHIPQECSEDKLAIPHYAVALFQSRVKHLHYWQKGE